MVTFDFIRNQKHGWTAHIISDDQSHYKTLCGMNMNREGLVVVHERPETIHTSWYVFNCERCMKKQSRIK